jgi:hypothetical protein
MKKVATPQTRAMGMWRGSFLSVVTVHRVDDSSEIIKCVQTENNVHENRNDQTEILDKRLRDSYVKDEAEIDYGLGIVESGTNSLEITEHSINVSGSKNKIDQNELNAKAKGVGAEAKSMETTSGRTCLINRDLSPLWDSYILEVKGIPPKESGVSKMCKLHRNSSLLAVCLQSFGWVVVDELWVVY